MTGPDFILPGWLCHLFLALLRPRFARLPAEAAHGFTIGGDEDPYLRRWFVTPKGDGPAVYLHQFLRDDDDRALHDHPWSSCGIILEGGYIEHTPAGQVVRAVGDVVLRKPEDRHRVELFREANGMKRPAWTLFLVGKKERDWGFWCPGDGTAERFVPWQDFTEGEHGERVGKGCGA
jgi:hypothetical protein